MPKQKKMALIPALNLGND